MDRWYGDADVEHLRLLVDLRRIDVPLDVAAQLAGWCHAGHCESMSDALPAVIAERRREIGERIERLRDLDGRLEAPERHLDVQLVHAGRPGRPLAVVGDSLACCDAARVVADVTEQGCTCCAPSTPG